MTQHERQMIANMASAALEELREAEYEYVKETFPLGFGWVNAQLTDYMRNIEGICQLITEWATLDRVARAFEIEYESTEKARDLQLKTWRWLEGKGE